MATRILHFGVDERAILSSLANGGYEVEECGTSVPNLSDALRRCQSGAVVVEEDGVALGDDVLASARSHSAIPFILFQGAERAYDSAYFDLVIPPCTPSKDWLREIDELIERNGAVRANPKSALERTSFLIEESVSLLEAAVTLHATSMHARGLREPPNQASAGKSAS